MLNSLFRENLLIRFEKHYEYKKLFFDFLYKNEFYSWYSNDLSQKISVNEEETNTFQIRIHQNTILFYCNSEFLKQFDIEPTEFNLDSISFQVGLIN
jgi:hypothetical protein